MARRASRTAGCCPAVSAWKHGCILPNPEPTPSIARISPQAFRSKAELTECARRHALHVHFRPELDEQIANPVTAKQTVTYGKLNVLSVGPLNADRCLSFDELAHSKPSLNMESPRRITVPFATSVTYTFPALSVATAHG